MMKSNQLRVLGAFFLVATIVLAVILFKYTKKSEVIPSSTAGIGTPSGGTGPITAPLDLPPRAASEIHAEWRASIQGLLGRYDQGRNATEMRDALLKLTVTNEDREQHLAFVLALNGMIDDVPQAKEKFTQVRQSFERAN